MSEHVCSESRTCTCSTIADTPNDDCPVHGSGPWPPRCKVCGRLMPWSCRALSPESIVKGGEK